MKKFDVAVVGELNADLILQDIPSFPEIGKEKTARNMILTMGSASAILASNIARLGLKVGFMGLLGRDVLGELVLETLKRNKVDTSGILISDKVKTGITVVMSFPEDYAMLTHMGAMESFSLGQVNFSYIARARHMHLSSYYLQPGLRPGYAELFKRCKNAGMTTSLDPGFDPDEKWDPDIFEVLKNVDIFLPNKQEALLISGEKNVDRAIKRLNGYAKLVVVKMGSKGAVCIKEDKVFRSGVYKADVVDTTGAGDSFNTGFLYRWLQGGDLPACMQYGAACGAIAVTKMGGSTASPTKTELDTFMKVHEPTGIE